MCSFKWLPSEARGTCRDGEEKREIRLLWGHNRQIARAEAHRDRVWPWADHLLLSVHGLAWAAGAGVVGARLRRGSVGYRFSSRLLTIFVRGFRFVSASCEPSTVSGMWPFDRGGTSRNACHGAASQVVPRSHIASGSVSVVFILLRLPQAGGHVEMHLRLSFSMSVEDLITQSLRPS